MEIIIKSFIWPGNYGAAAPVNFGIWNLIFRCEAVPCGFTVFLCLHGFWVEGEKKHIFFTNNLKNVEQPHKCKKETVDEMENCIVVVFFFKGWNTGQREPYQLGERKILRKFRRFLLLLNAAQFGFLRPCFCTSDTYSDDYRCFSGAK